MNLNNYELDLKILIFFFLSLEKNKPYLLKLNMLIYLSVKKARFDLMEH